MGWNAVPGLTGTDWGLVCVRQCDFHDLLFCCRDAFRVSGFWEGSVVAIDWARSTIVVVLCDSYH